LPIFTLSSSSLSDQHVIVISIKRKNKKNTYLLLFASNWCLKTKKIYMEKRTYRVYSYTIPRNGVNTRTCNQLTSRVRWGGNFIGRIARARSNNYYIIDSSVGSNPTWRGCGGNLKVQIKGLGPWYLLRVTHVYNFLQFFDDPH